VGQTKHAVEERFIQHSWPSGADTAIHRAIVKYGPGRFKVETLVEVPDPLLNDYEKKFIALFDAKGVHGYNQTSGGDINPMHDESVRAKHKATWELTSTREAHSTKMKSVMSDSHLRSRISTSLKDKLACSSSDEKAKRSQAVASGWLNNKNQRIENIRKALSKPDAKMKQRAGIKQALATGDTRKKHIEALRRIAKDPEANRKRSLALRAHWARKKGLPLPRE